LHRLDTELLQNNHNSPNASCVVCKHESGTKFVIPHELRSTNALLNTNFKAQKYYNKKKKMKNSTISLPKNKIS
jgi:hypothetical protein